MDYIDKKVLKNCLVHFMDSFEPRDLTDYIVQNSVLTENERELVGCEKTRQQRVITFLDFVKRKASGYKHVMGLLQFGQYTWIIDALNEEKSRLQEGGAVHPLDRIPLPARNRPLSSIEMLDMAKFMTMKWKQVAVRLGFTEPDIYTIQVDMQYEGPEMAAYSLLTKWSNRAPRDCTIAKLLEVMDREGIDYDEDEVVQMFQAR